MSRKMYSRKLRNFVLAEVKKLQEAELSGELEDVSTASAEEKDASEYADSLEQDIDFMKALNIQEKRLVKKLRQIHEAKNKLRTRVLRKIDKE